MFNTIIGAIATIVVVTLILVALLLVIKAKLTPPVLSPSTSMTARRLWRFPLEAT